MSVVPKVWVNGRWVAFGGGSVDETTIINTAVSQANDYTNQEIQQVNDDMSQFDQNLNDTKSYIDGAFKDGILTSIEVNRIKSYLNTLASDKSKYDKDYDSVYNNSDLSTDDKDSLSYAYQEYISNYNDLVSYINGLIKNSTVTQDDSDAVDQKFKTLEDAISLLTASIQASLNDIAQKKANDALDSANGYTDGKMAPLTQRVSVVETNVTTISGEISSMVSKDDYEVDLSNIRDSIDQTNTDLSNTKTYIDGAFKDGIVTDAESKKIASYLQSLNSDQAVVSNRYSEIDSDSSISSTDKTNLESAKSGYDDAYNKLVDDINDAIKDSAVSSTESDTVNDDLTTYQNALALVTQMMEVAAKDNALAKAQKSGDEAKAYADGLNSQTNDNINQLSDSLDDTKTYIDGSFKDGLISQTEANRIGTYLNTLAAEKANFDNEYNTVDGDSELTDGSKTNLETAYTNFTSAYNTLTSDINTVVQNGSVSSDDLTTINTDFGTYSDAVGSLGDALTNSINFIAQTKANASLASAKDYVNDQLGNYVTETVFTQKVSDLQAQVDGQIDTWWDSYDPTLDNAPASSWTSDADRDKHIGDLFLNSSSDQQNSGQAWRFVKDGSTYSWQMIKDNAIAKALQDAVAAQDTADHKRRVFVNTPAPPYDIGDLWAEDAGGDNPKLHSCSTAKAQGQSYSASDWELIGDVTALNKAYDTANVNGVGADAVINRLSSAESNVTQLSDEVSNSVTKTQYNQDMSSVNSKIDGLQVGNRNLLSKSGNFTDTSSWFYSSDDDYKVDFDSDNQAFRLTVNSVATGMHFGLKTTRKPVFTPGDQYTFTICYSLSGDSSVGWLFGIGSGTGLGGLRDFPGTNGEFKIAYYTGTFTDALSEASAIYSSTTGLAAGTVVEVKWAMLTAGNKPATDWSPAPEDPAASANGIIDDNGNVYGFTTTTGTIKNIGTKIILKVDESKSDGDNLVSIFNMDSTTAKLKASKIDLQGAVTFSTFDSSTQTLINNGNSALNGVNEINSRDLSNLVPNPSFVDNSTAHWTNLSWHGHASANDAPTYYYGEQTTRDNYGSDWFPVKGGETFFVKFDARGFKEKGNYTFGVGLRTEDKNHANPRWPIVSAGSPTGSWATHQGTITIDSNAAYARIFTQINNTADGNFNRWSFTNVIVSRSSDVNYVNTQATNAKNDAQSYADSQYSGTKSLVNGWKASGTTKINGGVIQTDYLSSICANLGTINSGDINIGSGKFHVNSSGNFTATNADIKGTVNATGGSLSNMDIDGQLRVTGSVNYAFHGVSSGNYWGAGDYQSYLDGCTMDGTVDISPGSQVYFIHLMGHISKAGSSPDKYTGDYGAMYLSPASMMMVDYHNNLRVSFGPGGPYYYSNAVAEADNNYIISADKGNAEMYAGNTLHLQGKSSVFNMSSNSTGDYLSSQSTANNHTSTSGSANLKMTASGGIYMLTSASKYKEDIEYDLTVADAKKILNVRSATWHDKRADEAIAKAMVNGEINNQNEDLPYLERVCGFVAEDIEDAGMNQLVEYGNADAGGNRKPNGVKYDRIPVYHNLILRDHEQEINLLKTRVTVLETILKQKGIVA